MKGQPRHSNKLNAYPKFKETVVFDFGLIPKEGVPEIKIRYTRSPKIFLGKVTNSKDAADFIRKTYPLGSIQLHERFVVIYIIKVNEILGYYRHSIGRDEESVADLRLIFATALASASSGLIVAHNHPSGVLYPSNPDIEFTNKLKAAGKILEIPLLDHLILSKTGYYSFADEGQI